MTTLEAPAHVHRLIIESPNGTPYVRGVCACGYERTYKTAGDYEAIPLNPSELTAARESSRRGQAALRKKNHGGFDGFTLEPFVPQYVTRQHERPTTVAPAGKPTKVYARTIEDRPESRRHNPPLTEGQQRVIAFVREHGEIGAGDLRAVLPDAAPKELSKRLRALVARGYLGRKPVPEWPGRFTYYVVQS